MEFQLLNDICEYRKGKINVSELTEQNYVSTENLLPNKSGLVEAASMPSTATTQIYYKNDILVSNIRPYFKKIWFAKSDGGCSNDVLVFSAKSGVDHNFLYYVLADDKFFEYSMSTAKGTKMPRGDKNALMNYEVPKIDITEQRKIGKFLRDIDDKIQINNQINRNLSEQAQEIFNEMLLKVDCIPEDWKKGSLLDIADYLNGLAMQKYRPADNEVGLPVLKIKELRQGVCDVSSELCSPNIKTEYIINDGDVIFSWSGSLLVDFWCGGKCGLNQHLFKVSSKQYDKWFYYAWTLHHLDQFIAVAADKATTMGHIKRGDLSKAEVLIPSKEDYVKICKLLKPMYEIIISNRIENRKLAEIRDSLLPRLMSGELDVSHIEI